MALSRSDSLAWRYPIMVSCGEKPWTRFGAPTAALGLFPIHASRTSAIAQKSNANAPERLPGSGKNLQLTLIIRPTSAIAREPGKLETPGTGKTGDHAIRSMWNETAYSGGSAGAGTKVRLQRWTRRHIKFV